MNLHEYQAKSLFEEYGIPVQKGDVATTADQAGEIATNLGGSAWLVKAQVHAGGRGKAGGVKFVESVSEVSTITKELLGKKLITHQSGPDGQPINSVLIASAAEIKEELYLGAVVDRTSKQITFMASAAGGMNIEEVAEVNLICEMLPDGVSFVPKIETLKGVLNLNKLFDTGKINHIMLDSEDLYTDVKNDVELFTNLKERVNRICNDYNVKLLQLYGVVFA